MEGGHQRAMEERLAHLDVSERRDFIAFTLRQRQPHLHRLFVTVSRRANLARLTTEASTASQYATGVKARGGVDEDLCRRVGQHASYLASIPSGVTPRTQEMVEHRRAADGAAKS